MKNLLFIVISAFQLVGCVSTKGQILKAKDMSGVYTRQESSERLELKSDGTFTLWNAKVSFTPVKEQCDYASKGKWSDIDDNVIEITSDNHYKQQTGFDYEIKKENKLSQDSLYIQVIFPTDFHPVQLDFTFNHNNSKSITADKTYIVLPKSKHLWDRRTTTNQISFSLNANVSGTTIYKSRIMFKIFEEYIDTEKYNFLTISLPNFDRCFFEFEPYHQELIYINGKNQLLWQGEIWKQ